VHFMLTGRGARNNRQFDPLSSTGKSAVCTETYVFVRGISGRSHAGFRAPISRGVFVHRLAEGVSARIAQSILQSLATTTKTMCLHFVFTATPNASVSLPLAGSAFAGIVKIGFNSSQASL